MFGLRRRILFPRHVLDAEPDAHRHFEHVQRLTRSIRGGDVEAWFLPAPSEGPAPVVVFAHGNGELIEHWPHMLAPYLDQGVSVLLPEYRGYGRSAGRPSEAGIVDDCRWFLERVRARPDVDEHRVVFHGRSIGGGVVCALSRHEVPHAMVLWSTFTSVDAVARRFGVPSFLVPDHFRSADALARLQVPTLIAHGTRDLLIPVEHAHELVAAAPHAELHLYDAGHNDCPTPDGGYWTASAAFLRRANIARA